MIDRNVPRRLVDVASLDLKNHESAFIISSATEQDGHTTQERKVLTVGDTGGV